MTREDVLYAIEVFIEQANKNGTVLIAKCFMNDISSLINQLQKEKEILSANADNAFQEGLNENRELFKNEVKAEVIKEFIEKLIYEIVNRPPEKAPNGVFYMNGRVDRQNEIIDIIKELAGVYIETQKETETSE